MIAVFISLGVLGLHGANGLTTNKLMPDHADAFVTFGNLLGVANRTKALPRKTTGVSCVELMV